MTDEAHRSQYSKLAANLDKGVPNASTHWLHRHTH
jgi:type I site-specific restriction-modification system R (restriction) subunit